MPLNRGDIVAVVTGPARGQIGKVLGEGNVWDYSLALGNGETGRFDPDQLVKIDLDMLIALASPVSERDIHLLAKFGA